jgi:hypothetical protein
VGRIFFLFLILLLPEGFTKLRGEVEVNAPHHASPLPKPKGGRGGMRKRRIKLVSLLTSRAT